ncbi:unnamed protein product [Ilex paraguariensis]|uniref:Uncharacterized protein n=1 Tax=Ilex paraguariensis TaxID=185542 RepID=A0ABC8SS87_9AQUA
MASSGSFGFSVSLVDVASEPEQSVGIQDDKLSTFPSLPRLSLTANSGGLDLFNPSSVPQTISSTSSATDLFQFPEALFNPSVDLFQPSPISAVPTLNSKQPSQISTYSSVGFFSEMPQQQAAASLNESSLGVIKNEGWATFDMPQHLAPRLGIENSIPATLPSSDGGTLRTVDTLLCLDTSLKSPAFHNSSAHETSSSIPDLWPTSHDATNTQSWNAFDDSIGHPSFLSTQHASKQVAMDNLPPIFDQHLGVRASEDIDKDGIQGTGSESGHPIPSIPSQAETHSHATDRKSTNPFDLPYDSDLESNDTVC